MKNSIILSFFMMLMISSTSLISFSASAEDSALSAKNKVSEIISKEVITKGENKDYAHKWFKDIFGGFIFAPWEKKDTGDNATLVSKVVGFTNILALILGVVIVYYVFIGGSINAAGKGEAMGQNWSGTWMPIRTIIGFGLIMPAGTLGGGVMSLSQVFILWIIMLGSNAGSLLWTSIGNEITDGVKITDPDIRFNRTQIAEIAKMMHCADVFVSLSEGKDPYVGFLYIGVPNKKKGRYLAGANANRGSDLIKKPVNVSGEKFGESKIYRMPEDEPFSGAYGSGNIRQVTEVSFGKNGKCGTLSFPLSRDSDQGNDYKIVAMNSGLEKGRELYMTDLLGHIHNIVYKFYKDGSNRASFNSVLNKRIHGIKIDTNEKAILSDSLFKSILSDYKDVSDDFSIEFPKLIHLAVSSDESIKVKFKKAIFNGGWGGAGVWYHELAEISSLSFAVMKNYSTDNVSATPDVCIDSSMWTWVGYTDDCEAYEEEFLSGNSIIGTLSSEIMGKSLEKSVSDEMAGDCSGAYGCSFNPNFTDRLAVSISTSILNILAEEEFGNDDTVSNTENAIVNPFSTLTSIGQGMNTFAGSLYAVGMGLTSVFGGDQGILSKLADVVGDTATIGAWSSIKNGFKAVLTTWIIPTMMALILALLSMGFTLAYVIPFLPIITWTLMVIGYLVTVIEALIAAPLAVIMMVTPEGEGISGTRLERAMQLIATAILKPSLMIIGLIASITVGFVGFQIWNEFFFKTAENVLSGSIFDVFAVLSIYTTTSFMICKLIIGIMHRLPNQILEWFSSGVGRSFGEDTAERGMEASAGELKQGTDKIGAAISGSIGTQRREKGNRKNAVLNKQ
jgi:conjugal transfer/type IV secretion protein DotA/TraY